jgi:hypothetical protein
MDLTQYVFKFHLEITSKGETYTFYSNLKNKKNYEQDYRKIIDSYISYSGH